MKPQLHAFDVLAGDGEDHCKLPLLLARRASARLLSRKVDGIFIVEYG